MPEQGMAHMQGSSCQGHNVEIWEEAHREPPTATQQLILKGYSGSSEMQCTL